MNHHRVSWVFVLLLVTVWGGFGQSDDDLFASSDAGTQPQAPASGPSDVTGKFLGTDQKLTWNGEWKASATSEWKNADPSLRQSLSLDLGLTARPDPNVRIGAKGTWSFNPGTGESAVHISEAFADFQGGDKVYFRVGKQFLSWGKGVFYSPADVLSLTAIDPADPSAVREGPTAFKASLEAGRAGTYQAVVSTELALKGSEVTFSGQGTWLLGGAEVSLGGFYQPSGEKAPRVFATTGFQFLDLNLYTESVVLWGDGQKMESRNSSLLTQETVGFSYSKDDAEKRWTLFASAQYEYNGAGASDLRGNRSHYLAGSLGLSRIIGSTVSLSATTLASLSEASWRTSPRVSWVANPDLTLGGQATLTGGAAGSEYAATGATAGWQVDAAVFSHLTLAVVGPLPGSEKSIAPQLKVTLSGFSF